MKRRNVLAGIGLSVIGGIRSESATSNTSTRYIIGTVPNQSDVVRRKAETVIRELEFGSRGRAIVSRLTESARIGLETDPHIRYIERDVPYRAAGGPVSVESQRVPSGIERINACLAHKAGITGDGVHVAVLDTGIDPTHETLAENLGSGVSFVECAEQCGIMFDTETDCGERWDDDDGHGTHVAGTIGAADDGTGVVGVAPDVTLHAVKVLDCARNGSLSTLVDAITYVTDQGWDVANLSLGGPADNEALRDACEYAAANGVILVAAAGSNGPCADCVYYPAAYDSVVAVSGVDENDELVSESRIGPEVELAAPGTDVFSTVPEPDAYDRLDGSSAASPHVAGAAALLLANGYPATEVRQRLRETAVDIGLEPERQGHGLLDVAGALELDNGEIADGLRSTTASAVDRAPN